MKNSPFQEDIKIHITILKYIATNNRRLSYFNKVRNGRHGSFFANSADNFLHLNSLYVFYALFL